MSHPDDATQPQAGPSGAPPYQPMYPPPPPPPVPPGPPVNTPPYGAVPPPAVPPRETTPHGRESRHRALTALAVACFLVAAALVGYTAGADNGDTNAIGSFPSSQQIPDFSGSSSTSGQQSNIDVNAIAAKVSPSIVNLTSNLDGGEAAGTGIMVTSSGLVLTNNHVIAYSNDLQAEIGGDGEQHAVKVLGYDIENDVALVQIEDVSGLTGRVARELVRPRDRRRHRRPRQRRGWRWLAQRGQRHRHRARPADHRGRPGRRATRRSSTTSSRSTPTSSPGTPVVRWSTPTATSSA